MPKVSNPKNRKFHDMSEMVKAGFKFFLTHDVPCYYVDDERNCPFAETDAHRTGDEAYKQLKEILHEARVIESMESHRE